MNNYQDILMRTRTSAHTRKPEPSRRLTVGYHYYEQRKDGKWAPSRTVPMLRLSGHWLEQAGFVIGEKVTLKVSGQRITITPDIG